MSPPPSSGPNPVAARGADREDERQFANLTATAYEQLRTDVLRGRLRPGEKLGAEALRQRFSIGASPIREALNRLLAEGLVALEAQKGFRVASVSEAELRELVTARSWIDGAAVSEAIARGEEQWEERLIVALHRLSRSPRPSFDETGVREWEDRHKTFHQALVSGCGTRWIMRISDQLFDAAERYRLLAADQVPERDELAEHKEIVDACLSRDSELAVRLLAEHYRRTYTVIVPQMVGERV